MADERALMGLANADARASNSRRRFLKGSGLVAGSLLAVPVASRASRDKLHEDERTRDKLHKDDRTERCLLQPDDTLLHFLEFQATGPSISINIDGRLHETGPITFTLAPEDPPKPPTNGDLQPTNFETLDFRKMTLSEKVDYHVTAPLLENLGLPPVSVLVTESGEFTFSETSGRDSQNIDLAATMVGNGIAGTGTIFEGWSWRTIGSQSLKGECRTETEIDPITGRIKFKIVYSLSGSELTSVTASDPHGTIHNMSFQGTGVFEHIVGFFGPFPFFGQATVVGEEAILLPPIGPDQPRPAQ
jgi:hypothetical protein